MSHNMIGQKLGRLIVISEVPKENRIGGADARRRAQFLCSCECGKTIIVSQANLIAGRTESCGCLRQERRSEAVATHGLTKRKQGEDQPRLYHIWRGMKQRCYKSNVPQYKNYGARGITVCDEWKNSFAAFHAWAIANGYQDDLSLDRINNAGPYSPDNCRWATAKQQSANTRRAHRIEYGGGIYTVNGLAEHLSVSTYQIKKMLLCGELKEIR